MTYLHLYLSSKCPLHSSIKQTLKDKTRTRPLRALKSNEFIDLAKICYPSNKLEMCRCDTDAPAGIAKLEYWTC